MKVYTDISDFKNVKNPVVTTGTFDGVHFGHQKIIDRLKSVATKIGGESVLLTFHPHPRMVLFPDDEDLKLLSTREEKIKRLESAGLDHLIIYPFSRKFSRRTATEYVRDLLVNEIGVKTLVIGYDHQFGRNREGNFEQLIELAGIYDFKLEEIPAQELDDVKVSSTKIRNALLKGDVKTASKYLSHDYKVSGIVVKGRQLGRELGFPTANISVLDRYKLIPGDGVYAVNVKVNKGNFKGMLNIGYRPTVGGLYKATMEVNIFEFNENIYGHFIGVEFVKRLRDEIKFDSVEELKIQLELDKIQALNAY
ncbi:MAG: bifunctional riboflavin kinase/FAD synthetase [Crocinitomicaceae bacterium]|nr:bifunctional riboflavin kinase/FAD synthetase [Crocinitomicaceae bacterium]MBT5403991.1 bifunctional riboflavin kinase/FAD synthetase [Crocinitomicaceae bacterium]MBT6030880.1 bifunctional riboflavin kinase/FAD synthetase [Crocinitomicaceae bacterium]MBT6513762.1 bifunctional riboflavin kinase/FAD synthetase [Crocinitomicaceae bacterium]